MPSPGPIDIQLQSTLAKIKKAVGQESISIELPLEHAEIPVFIQRLKEEGYTSTSIYSNTITISTEKT